MEEIYIAGRRVSISYIEMEEWGAFDLDEMTIYISSVIKEKEKIIETIRHEALHATFQICGLSYLDSFEEECIVRCFENVFLPSWDEFLLLNE